MPSSRELCIRLLDAPFPRDVRRILLPDRGRILITQFDKLGDVLCSTAAIHMLREHLLDAHLAVAVQPYARAVLEGNPDVDEILELSVPWSSARFAGSVGERLRRVREVGRGLRARRFDLGLDLQGNPLNALLLRLAGIPIRVGMCQLGGNAWLTAGQRMDWFANRVAFRLRLIERLTGRGGEPKTRFFVPTEEREWVHRTVCRPAGDLPVVAVCPLAENPVRMWPRERYVELGRRLAGKAALVLPHAPGEAALAASYAEAWRDLDHCEIVQTDTLARLGAVLSASTVVVTGDSAPMHLAVAVGTPVVALFGPSPPSAAGPLDWEVNRVLEPAILCGPCLWGPHAAACESKRCLKSISVDRVARAVFEVLGR